MYVLDKRYTIVCIFRCTFVQFYACSRRTFTPFDVCSRRTLHHFMYVLGVRYTITLAAYSGNQDPEWNIDSSNPMYNEIAWAVNRRPPTRYAINIVYRNRQWHRKLEFIKGQMAPKRAVIIFFCFCVINLFYTDKKRNFTLY